MEHWDVGIVGAGVAGLAATAELSRVGLRVLCFEATNRIGGRVFTVHDPVAQLPIELGAEFIHGLPQETWNLVRASGLTAYQHNNEAVHIVEGRVLSHHESGESADKLLSRLSLRGKDRTLRESVKQAQGSPAAEKWAVAHIEGFNAARQ